MPSRRTLPAILLLALLATALLVWLLRAVDGEREATAVEAAVPGDERAAPELVVGAVPETSGRALTGAAGAALEGGLPVPVGVRLPGRGRLDGRVLDRASGAPVANARVDLQALPPVGENLIGRILRCAGTGDGFASRVSPVAVTRAGPDGRFSFEGVRAGRYFAEARGPLFVPESPRTALVAESGAGGPIELWVRSGGRVTGVVVRANGAPVVGAKVAAFTGWGGMLGAMRTGDLHYEETESGAGGTFLLAGLPPGDRYEVAAVGQGFAPAHVVGVEVRPGEDSVVRVEVGAGATVRGRVLSRGEDGEEPSPLAGAHVGAVPRGLRDLHFVLEILEATHAVTDGSGRYRIDNAPIGEVDVVAIAPLHLPGKSRMLRAAPGGAEEAEDVLLKPGPVVRGRVVDSAGVPVAGAHVRWELVDWGSFQFDLTLAPLLSQAVEGFEFPITDAEGRFVAGPFADDAPHQYEVHCVGFDSVYPRWDPHTGDEVTVTLRRGGAVEGIVMDEEAAAPVTRFTLSTDDRLETRLDGVGGWNPFSGGILVEDETGRFRLDDLRAGTIDLAVSADGYLPALVEDLSVAEGETRRGVIVRMQRGGVVRGIVLDPDGEPVVGAQVLALDSGAQLSSRRRRARNRAGLGMGDEIPPGALGLAAGIGIVGDASVLSATDGTFELTGIAEGPLRVAATHRDYAGSELVELELEGAATIDDVQVVMREGGALFGRVTDRFGRPVSGANLIVGSPEELAGDSPSSGGAHDARTDANGDYRIEHVSGGTYFVLLLRDDAAASLMSIFGTLQVDLVTIPEGEEVRQDIVDRSAAACRVHGTVTSSGAPVEGGMIFAVALETDSLLGLDVKVAAISPDGAYSFPGLAPGEYAWTIGGRGPDVYVDVEVPDLPEHRLDVSLPEGGLHGVVLDDLSGEPVARAEVLLRALGAPDMPDGLLAQLLLDEQERDPSEYTDRDGGFGFGRLAGGEYQLLVHPPRWGDGADRYAPSDPVRVVVHDGVVERGLEVRLSPTLVLAGRVVDPDGAPVPRALVSARLAGGESVRPARTSADEEGAFELRSLRPGTYVVTASADGFAPAIAAGIDLSGGGRDDLVLALVRGVRVRALVLAPDGSPAAGALGRLLPADGPAAIDPEAELEGLFRGDRVTGASGELDLGLFLPGRYHLEVVRGGQRGALEDVLLEEGPPVELLVRLE
jgi:protocatechuate 3,4-dioxygenase beta subunit